MLGAGDTVVRLQARSPLSQGSGESIEQPGTTAVPRYGRCPVLGISSRLEKAGCDVLYELSPLWTERPPAARPQRLGVLSPLPGAPWDFGPDLRHQPSALELAIAGGSGGR